MRLVLLVLALAGCVAAPAAVEAPPRSTPPPPACTEAPLSPGAEGDLAPGDVRLLTFALEAPADVAASAWATHGRPHLALVSATACDEDRRLVAAEREEAGRTTRLAARVEAGSYAFALTCAPGTLAGCGFALEAHLRPAG